ncbi:beta strand repeat-containing protein [Adhaeribacter terreus]|uniref:Beta strand repeat-containing protein n=1 Tax=Adhaeribacter terreus TaxID=529703 RepID=A0ABW0E717_9BACT
MNQYYFRKQAFQGLKHEALKGCSRPTRFFSLLLLALCFGFMPNANAQQTPQFAKDASTSTNSMPFNSNGAKRLQNFYYANELVSTSATVPGNAHSGMITRIYYKAQNAGIGTYLDLKVKMGQTTANSFPGTAGNTFFTNLTTVFASASHTFGSSAADEWVPLDLTTPFLYDAGKPLIIEVQMTGRVGTAGFTVRTSSSPSNMPQRRVYNNTSSTALTSPTGSADRTWPDFGIDVTATAPCTTPPTAGTAVASVPFVCPNTNFQLSMDGADVGTDITYQWQSSTDGTNWTNIPNATGSIFTTTQQNTTFYRAQTICSSISSPSNAVTVVTNPSPMSGTYTVNKNAPFSPTGNYQSLNDLVQDLTCRGASGPVTVNVVAGSGPYNEQVVITNITGINATNPLVFNGNGNAVTFEPTSANRSIFRLDSADYVTINNFELTTTGTYGWVIQLSNGADHNVISNNIINSSATTTTETSGTGIVFSSSNTELKTGNNGNHNVIIGNTITGGYKSIHLASAVTAAGNNQIKNNIMKDFYATGILLDAAQNTLVEGNDLSRVTRTTANYTFCGIELKGNSAGNIIAKNRLHNTHDTISSTTSGYVYMIYLNSTDAAAGSENIIKNNLIYNIKSLVAIYGIYNLGSDGAYFYNNTVVLDANTTKEVRGFAQSTSATNIKFNNNLIYLGGSGAGARHALYLNTAASSIAADHNVYYIDPALANKTLAYYSVAYATLADWQTANSGAFDQHALFADPMFDNPATGNYAPTNSMLNNAAAALTEVTDDITGAPRSTTPDPGAYEFVPVGFDAGIVALVTPVSPAAPASQQAIQVSIKNYGATILTSMVINWSVDGVAQTPFNWTGSLAGGQISAPVTVGNFTFASGAYNLEFCTASPNNATDSNTSNDCFTTTMYACAPLAGTYTIDQNSPVSATNFQSVTAAAESLNNCGISGPVVFNVTAASGPYIGQVQFQTIGGASAANTVTFNGNGNTISFKATANDRQVIKLDGTDFVTISDFTIAATDSTYGWGIHLMNGADNNVFSNNTINVTATNTTADAAVGIVFSNANTAVSIAGNTGNNNVISGNTISGGYKGIHLNSDLTAPGNNQIINNNIRDFYYDGIRLNAAKGTLVEGNDISRPTLTIVNTFTAIAVAGNSQQTVISKNRIHNSHGGTSNSTTDAYGISVSSSDAPVGSENIIKNNLMYNINNIDVVYGIYNVGSDGMHVFHNTFDLSNPSSTGTVRGFYQVNDATNIKFVNNIVNIASSASGNKYGVNFNTPTSTIISNNNVINVPVGITGRYGTNDFLTMAAWTGANSNAYDQNSVSTNPMFINPAAGNYIPNAVGVDNIGQPLANVTDDIDGAPRSATTPDAGAFEFSVPVDNVGIVAISGPAANCGLSSQESITVTIKNFGTSVQTSIPVTYSLNGVVMATETFTGTLAYNATANYTFAAKADLSVAGPYTIVASTMLTGDNTPSNDSDTLKIANSLMPNATVNIDFETVANGLDAMRKVVNARANVKEDTAASFGAASTKGMIMDGVDHASWTIPTGANNPWSTNMDNFSGVYMCLQPKIGSVDDSLILTFDLKQLYKTASANTNFRVTVNGQQIGNTYNPPFGGYGAGGATWSHVKINLTAFLNQPTIQIGLESNVKEPFAKGTGTANLIDNINVQHYRITTGVKEALAANAIKVYPNPNNGTFSVTLNGLTQGATLAVYNLAGQLIATENVKAGQQEANMNLKGLAAGTYLLKVTSDNKVNVTRLIVQ